MWVSTCDSVLVVGVYRCICVYAYVCICVNTSTCCPDILICVLYSLLSSLYSLLYSLLQASLTGSTALHILVSPLCHYSGVAFSSQTDSH